MSEWQPIATAPKDGSPVLLAHGSDRWTDYWVPYSSASDDGYWSACGPDGAPTHWMPLHEPPDPLKEGE